MVSYVKGLAIHRLVISDADCGKGFKRIEDQCLNISYSMARKNDIQDHCSSINAKPLLMKSASMFHQLKDFLLEFANGDPVWTDFVGVGDTINDYINEDQKTTTELEIHKAWKATGAFGKPCVVMVGGNDYLMESVDCSTQAKFICVKDTCPDGFSWFDHKSCIKVMNEPSTKSDAEVKCMGESPRATLFMPKTQQEQRNLEKWLRDSTMTTNFFLGAKKIENGWVWDDGKPVFINGSSLSSTYSSAIDGQIFGTNVAVPNSQSWLQIDLPEFQLIPQVKLFIDSV